MPIQLRQLINTLQTQINYLKSFKQQVESWYAILVPITVYKLDSTTVKGWETKLNINTNNDEIPSIDDLLEFLSNKVSILEIIARVNRQNSQIRSFNTIRRTNYNTKMSTLRKPTFYLLMRWI